MITNENVIETPGLAEWMKEVTIPARAMVYVHAYGDNGMNAFLRDMAEIGIPGEMLKEGEHYVINEARTSLLRAYTGEVWLRDPVPIAVMYDITPWVRHRDSHPHYTTDGYIHIYNNPLFRRVVALGTWVKSPTVKIPRGPSHESVELSKKWNRALSKADLEICRKDLTDIQAAMAKSVTLAKALHNSNMHELAKDHAKKATIQRRKALELEVKISRIELAYPQHAKS